MNSPERSRMRWQMRPNVFCNRHGAAEERPRHDPSVAMLRRTNRASHGPGIFVLTPARARTIWFSHGATCQSVSR